MKIASMSFASLVIAALALAACDRGNRHVTRVELTDPSPVFAGVITPQPLPLAPVAGGVCPFLTPLTTAFDIAIDLHGSEDFFLEQVTIRLIDGSSVGGSPVLMSSADLAARLASTRVRRGTTSHFRFTPMFGCHGFRPRSLSTDLQFRGGSGALQTLHLAVPVG